MPEVFIPAADGTIIGDFTDTDTFHSQNQAFDGDTTEGSNSCAATQNESGYIGKQYSAGKIFSRMVVYGSDNDGFSGNSGESFTINVRGNNSAPGSRSDGTLIGTITFNDPDDATAQIITSTDLVNHWTYIWAEVINNGSATPYLLVAEIEIYEWVNKTGIILF